VSYVLSKSTRQDCFELFGGLPGDKTLDRRILCKKRGIGLQFHDPAAFAYA
jgi:hypothetical protein